MGSETQRSQKLAVPGANRGSRQKWCDDDMTTDEWRGASSESSGSRNHQVSENSGDTETARVASLEACGAAHMEDSTLSKIEVHAAGRGRLNTKKSITYSLQRDRTYAGQSWASGWG